MSDLVFRSTKKLETPVLFLVFNRLDVTAKVFSAIRQAKPPRLYIACDGPREDRVGEFSKVDELRNYLLANVDWPCEVSTLFRDKNLGCKLAVSSAISWFFEHEPQGIILEDDCLPSQSFFWYCEELLERYKNDQRIGMISGDNFQNGRLHGDADYYYSIYNHIWGWASWADRWKLYDVNLTDYMDSEFINPFFEAQRDRKFWSNLFYKMKRAEINTWDYQWTFTLWKHNFLTVLPNKNLVQNLGFGADATHTTGESDLANMKSYDLVLSHYPSEVERCIAADKYTQKHVYHATTLIKLKRLIKRLRREM